MGSPVSVVVLYLVHKEERGEDLAFLALIFTQLSRQQFHTFSRSSLRFFKKLGFCIDIEIAVTAI